MAWSSKNSSKLEIVKDIQEAKEVLFAVFSEKCTKIDKMEAWKIIHEKALALGLVPSTKDFSYTRDTLWQNFKKNSLKKLERQTSDCAENIDSKLTEIDKIVLDIVGKEIPEKCTTELCNAETLETADIKSIIVNNVNEPDATRNNILKVKPQSKLCTSTLPINNTVLKKRQLVLEDSEDILNRRKQRLEIEIKEKESYLKTLEIFKIERELAVPPSKFTKHFTDKIQDVIYVVKGSSSK